MGKRMGPAQVGAGPKPRASTAENLSRARSWRRCRAQGGPSNRNRSDRFRQSRRLFARRCDQPGAGIWLRDGRGRQRRHRILQGVHARHERGELIGYSFQIRLLSCEAQPEGLQISCALPQRSCVLLQRSCVLLQDGCIFLQRRSMLLLGRLNVLQCVADGGIRYWN